MLTDMESEKPSKTGGRREGNEGDKGIVDVSSSEQESELMTCAFSIGKFHNGLPDLIIWPLRHGYT